MIVRRHGVGDLPFCTGAAGQGPCTPLYQGQQMDVVGQQAQAAALAVQDEAARAGCDPHPDITARVIATQGPAAYFYGAPRGARGAVTVPPEVQAAYQSNAGIKAIMDAWISSEGPVCKGFGTQMPDTIFQPVQAPTPSVPVAIVPTPAAVPVQTVGSTPAVGQASPVVGAVSPVPAASSAGASSESIFSSDSLGLGLPNWVYLLVAGGLLWAFSSGGNKRGERF